MSHLALHLTWDCVNQCPYCWVRNTVYKRPELRAADERSASDWIMAIRRERPDIVELLGGEPFLYGALYEIVEQCPQTRFGLSTNGVLFKRVHEFAARPRLGNLCSVNVSYHPYAGERVMGYLEKWQGSVSVLRRAGYTVSSNIVDFPGNKERAAEAIDWLRGNHIPYMLNPYEDVYGLDQKREPGLCCKGGTDHLLIAPNGDAWPCFTSFRSPYWQEYRLGNWIEGTVDAKRKPVPCYLDCVDYYVLPQQHSNGDMWNVGAKPC